MSGRSVSFEHLWRNAGGAGNDFVCILAMEPMGCRASLKSVIFKFESETFCFFCG